MAHKGYRQALGLAFIIWVFVAVAIGAVAAITVPPATGVAPSLWPEVAAVAAFHGVLLLVICLTGAIAYITMEDER